ncbi:hypothetical protein [Postechiella marina]|uniref:hypothetical protein n=1 Tax=Postechiella marina TaxID=943941 RepID=UPI0031D58501
MIPIGFAQTKENLPNIVLIMGDNIGCSNIGAYGGEIETPNTIKPNTITSQPAHVVGSSKPTESRRVNYYTKPPLGAKSKKII